MRKQGREGASERRDLNILERNKRIWFYDNDILMLNTQRRKGSFGRKLGLASTMPGAD
jgi:hypothetical protein